MSDTPKTPMPDWFVEMYRKYVPHPQRRLTKRGWLWIVWLGFGAGSIWGYVIGRLL